MRGYIWEGERRVSGASVDWAAFRNLAIEGEVAVYIVDSSPPDIQDWVVDWAPVIELHHFVFDGKCQG